MGPDDATLPRMGRALPRCRPSPLVPTVALVVAACVVLIRLAGRTVRRVEVVGDSMAPALVAGDRLVVLVRPLGRQVWPAVGTVVAVADPRDERRTLVKRVASVNRAASTLEVLGDDPDASTDSRVFGPVPLASVVGRVIYRYAPAGRTGPGPWPREYDRR